jgi:hypothetical protein
VKISPSIELIWQLAGHEAIAGEFKEIQPEHFCLGLLKLAELPVQEAAKLGVNEAAAKVLTAEVAAVRSELAKLGIDATQLRRALRGRLGKGGHPYTGGQMHRSQASRDLFEAAARAADQAGSEVLAASHLLEAILKSPTPALAGLLRGAGGPKPPPATKTPLLDQHGQDLGRKAAELNLSGPGSREVEGRALLHGQPALSTGQRSRRQNPESGDGKNPQAFGRKPAALGHGRQGASGEEPALPERLGGAAARRRETTRIAAKRRKIQRTQGFFTADDADGADEITEGNAGNEGFDTAETRRT